MRIPTDVVESLKAVAPMRGFTAYQTLWLCHQIVLVGIAAQRLVDCLRIPIGSGGSLVRRLRSCGGARMGIALLEPDNAYAQDLPGRQAAGYRRF
jgi:hypothetical protein